MHQSIVKQVEYLCFNVLVFFSLSNYSYFINITYYIAISSNQMNLPQYFECYYYLLLLLLRY